MNIPQELRVYIIENEQPFENWFGTLKSYYPTDKFCEIKDNKENIHKLDINNVYEAESLKLIKEILI